MCQEFKSITHHALLNSAVGYNINDVADFVLLEVGGERDGTLLLEVAREGCSNILASLVRLFPLPPNVFSFSEPSPEVSREA